MTNPEPSRASAAAVSFDPMRAEPARIRFVDLRTRRSPAGQAFIEVELERIDGVRVTGASSGQPAGFGDLRIAAEATIQALGSAVATGHRFELTGVKTVRAFDTTVVLVSVTELTTNPPQRLLGAAFAENQSASAAVLAVLNATNRVLCKPRLPEG
jgi:hypothetical protein